MGPEYTDRGATVAPAEVDVDVVFARGSVASQLAAQARMLDTLLAQPERLRDPAQVAAIAQRVQILQALDTLPDSKLIAALAKGPDTPPVVEASDPIAYLATLGQHIRDGRYTQGELDELNDTLEGLFEAITDAVSATEAPSPVVQMETLVVAPTLQQVPKPGPIPRPPQAPQTKQEVALTDEQKVLWTANSLLRQYSSVHIAQIIHTAFGTPYVEKGMYDMVCSTLQSAIDTGQFRRRKAIYYIGDAPETVPDAPVPARAARTRVRRQINPPHEPQPSGETLDDIVARARQAGISPAVSIPASSTNKTTARKGGSTRHRH